MDWNNNEWNKNWGCFSFYSIDIHTTAHMRLTTGFTYYLLIIEQSFLSFFHTVMISSWVREYNWPFAITSPVVVFDFTFQSKVIVLIYPSCIKSEISKFKNDQSEHHPCIEWIMDNLDPYNHLLQFREITYFIHLLEKQTSCNKPTLGALMSSSTVS